MILFGLAALALFWCAVWFAWRPVDDFDLPAWINEPNERAAEWLARGNDR